VCVFDHLSDIIYLHLVYSIKITKSSFTKLEKFFITFSACFVCRSLLPAQTRIDKRERERAESAEREQREQRREMSQQHQPKWKLHKGPSNPSILVGEKGFKHYARNEFIDSEDVEEKTTSFYQNRAIEAYWMHENQLAREIGRGRIRVKNENSNNNNSSNNVTVQSRVEAMRNKTKHKHFQSSLEEVLKDPLPPPPRRSSLSEKKMQKEKEEEEEEEEEELETEEETDEDEEDEDVRKMVDELKRLRSKAAAAAAATATTTSNRGENDDDEEEQPSWKTWYFPPTHEYGSFIPKVNSKKSPLGWVEEIPERVVIINNNNDNNNNSVDDDRENALREKKRLEKARLYQKSRNLETHKLW